MIGFHRPAWFSSFASWQQVVLILASYVAVATAGSFLIAPTGPGSDRILYVVLVGYSALLIWFGSKIAKTIGLLLLLASLVGVVLSTMARHESARKLWQRGRQGLVYPAGAEPTQATRR